MNEIANYCELVGANVDHVRQAMGSDDRIGNRFLFPGIGYGGSCFPKDVKALKKLGDDLEQPFAILSAVDRVNTEQKKVFTAKIEAHFKGALKGKKFALWGLSFKPGTDDVREAPAFYVIETLLKQGASFTVFDPVAIGIICQWENPSTSKGHVFTSENIWFDPNDYMKSDKITVLIDKRNPKKHIVDLSFLPEIA